MKNIFRLILLIALGATAYWIYQNKGISSTNKGQVLKDFAVGDTSKVDQIYMSHPNGKEVLITRRNLDNWMVNNEFKARPDAINLILKTLHDVQIQSEVSQKTFEGVVKRLATGHTKVEIYQGKNKPVKVWYIGDPTPSKLGAYALLEVNGKKSSKPYVLHMLMERGYLGSRFFIDPLLWREPLVMSCNPKNIKKIEVWHSADTLSGFAIRKIGIEEFEIKSHHKNDWEDLDPRAAISYFKEFEKVHYEYVDVKTEQAEFDSIYFSPFRHQVKVSMEDGSEIEMRTFNMPVVEGATLGGEPIYFHPERMYAYSSFMDENSHPIVQNLTFDLLVPAYEDFKTNTIVEKLMD